MVEAQTIITLVSRPLTQVRAATWLSRSLILCHVNVVHHVRSAPTSMQESLAMNLDTQVTGLLKTTSLPRATDKTFKRSALFPLLSFALVFCLPKVSATLIPVRHKEGTSHGFLVLRSQDGQTLATGSMIQTVEDEDVTNELVLHFKDGSVYDELTAFSQEKVFRLVRDHLHQQGASFPEPLDVDIDVASGNVVLSSNKDGERKNERHHLKLPEDVSNGLILTVLKNISHSERETTVPIVATSLKPRVVRLKIHSEGEQAFSASGEGIEAIHYVIHADIGGIAGVLASVIGKQPADVHFWIVGGKAPTFVKFTGQLYDGGPLWSIELATVK